MLRNVLGFSTAMFIAGTIGVFVTEANISTVNALFFRCLIAAVLLAAYCWNTGQLRLATIKSPELPYVIVGGLFLVANWGFLFQAFTFSSITLGIVAYYTAPFFLIVLGALFLNEATTRASLLWTVVGFGGLLLISFTGAVSVFGSQTMLLGIGFGLLAALLYASVTAIGRKIQTFPPPLTVLIQMVIGTLALIPLVDFQEITAGAINWPYIIVLGVVHTAVLYILFFRSVRRVPIYLIAPLAFIDPLVAILSDVLIYRTSLTLLQVVGIGLILLASYFVSRRRQTPPTDVNDGDGIAPQESVA